MKRKQSSIAWFLVLIPFACILWIEPRSISKAINSIANPEPPQIDIAFQSANHALSNPERGFSVQVNPIKERDYSEYYTQGYTLIHLTIRLDEYRSQDLPPLFLTRMENWFELIRQAGIKTIVRFAYNNGPNPNPEPDASKEQIIRHIQQVGAVLNENSDVIAWFEAGFIGAWGEWHSSTNDLDEDSQAKRDILFAALNNLPVTRMVLLRYPSDIMTVFPTPLPSEQAFAETSQARVGFHNDCFLATENDMGTYQRLPEFTREDEVNYLEQMTQFTAVGGETCALNPPRSDCPTALQEMESLHFTQLNHDWFPAVIEEWQEQGCYQDIQRRLGYRFSLDSASFNQTAAPGGILDLTVDLENSGFAPLLNPRQLYLVLDGASRFNIALPVEPRQWEPGQQTSFHIKLRLPANIAAGSYALALWLPDESTRLRGDSRYSVQFANQGIWDEANGYNVLWKDFSVTPLASGAVDPQAENFQILP